MAGENLELRDENSKTRPAMDQDPRFVHLEGRVDRLESDVRDIKTGVNKLLERPQNPGLMQVLGGAVTVLVVIGFIFGFARFNLNEAVQPVKDQLAVIAAETKERFVVLTHKLEKTDDISVEARVKAAMLEERSIWMKSQGSWQAKAER